MLCWRQEQWPTSRILSEVGHILSDELNHKFDYETFNGKDFEPGLTMDRIGTWNIPIIILESPLGFITRRGKRHDLRYWLIEGHQRMRYLNALYHRNACAEKHFVYILNLLSGDTG